MAGLLDGILGTSFDDPKTAATLALAQGLLTSPKAMQGLNGGLLGYQGALAEAKKAKQADEMRQMQMMQHQMALEQAKRQAAQQAQQDAFRQSIPSPQFQTGVDALAVNGGMKGALAPLPKADPNAALLHGAMKAGMIDPIQYIASQRKDNTPIKLGAGEALLDPKTLKPLFTNPKEDSTPSAVKEYNFAVGQGETRNFTEWQAAQKRAGAPSMSVKVDNKMGESLAGQVGPMAKDSRIQTQGAVKMFDAADRLEAALNSKLVTAGPLASKIQTVKQFVQVVGGGNDESIRQTRQVIKSLAQMSVEARKQLQGQGQVTDSEGAAVAKADSGDINDLTTGELRDLVTLTKRAAHFQAKAHQDVLSTMSGRDETKGLVPFYNVPGLDPLLKHQPVLPQIGGGQWSIKPIGGNN